jgi:D-alanyl-D-alanine carboxypeptidase (penicillin-binding protein 5/6)
VDGLKTGHTEVAGYGITLSAKDPATNRRVILIINGLSSDNERVEEGGKLISYGLKAFENKTIVKSGDILTDLPVWFGSKERIGVVAEQDVLMTVPKASNDKTSMKIDFESPVPSPIKKGQEIATLTITTDNQPPMVLPLVAVEDVAPARGITWFKALITQWLNRA